MTEKLNFITGATGLLGSHIADQLVERGEKVRGLVRSTSDTTFLEQLGVELAVGDMQDPASLQKAVQGASVVFHCAAKVSDWGPWSGFQKETVDATRNLVEACAAAKVERLLHVSSLSVYGQVKKAEGELNEDLPLGQKLWMWDHYARSKILAEEEARKFDRHTIVRPSWIYGPRDRVTIPRVVTALRSGKVPIIGSGDNYLNLIYAGDVARGAILAAHAPEAIGEVFNLCSEGELTQRQMVDTLTDELGLPRVTKRVPFFLAFRFAFVQEALARMIGRKNPPRITRRAIYLIGRPTQFSTKKAREQLGWRPEVDIETGVQRALAWFLAK